MNNFHTMTVREIALEVPASSRVFEQYKIDYCCHGDLLFDEACTGADLDPDTVIKDIDAVIGQASTPDEDKIASLDLSGLIEHIVDKHHKYTYAEIEQLPPLMEKVASRHGDHLPNLHELKHLFGLLCDDLSPHMMKEDRVLFPYIEDLERGATTTPPFGTVLNPVRMMRSEHETVGNVLARMRNVTDDYALPDWACPSFTALYRRLEDLERDLHQHIHLENNVLFPRAVELEQKRFTVTA